MKAMNFIIVPFFILTSLAGQQAVAESRERMVGDSQIEREIRWSWKYLKNIVHSCLESKTDCQDVEVRKVLIELDGYLPYFNAPQAASWASLLTFVSETTHPGVFTSIDGDAHRLAITELKKNSSVMINTDRMNRPLEEWVGLLAHESVHHLGYADDATRLPDRIATEITNHFKRRQSISTLAQFNRPDARNLVFNPSVSGLTIGFLSSSEMTFDIEWGPTPLAQLCPANETIARQFVGSPVWAIEYMKKKTGVVTLRGGGFVNVMCRPKGTNGSKDKGHRWLIGANVDLQYSAPLNLSSWKTETPEILMKTASMGASTWPADAMWGPNQSFWVSSVNHESAVLQAGTSWKTEIVVKSTDGHAPQTCELYFSGALWPHAKQHSLPAAEIFHRCAVTKLTGDQYLLTASHDLPANMQPEDFYISLIHFPDAGGSRFAFPQIPSYVRVENPTAIKPASIKSVEVKGLSVASTLQELDLKDSFKAKAGEKFQIEIAVDGDQGFGEIQVELLMWTPRGLGRAPLFVNGPALGFSEIFSNTRVTKTPTGSTVVLDLVLPKALSGYPIMAMKLARVYFATSDLSYVEHDNANESEGVIVEANFAK